MESKKHPGIVTKDIYIYSMNTTPIPEVEKVLKENEVWNYEEHHSPELWQYLHTANEKVKRNLILAVKELRNTFPNNFIGITTYLVEESSGLHIYVKRFNDSKHNNLHNNITREEYKRVTNEYIEKIKPIYEKYTIKYPGITLLIDLL